MLNHSQVWRRQFACFTASLLAAVQPALLLAQEPQLPAKLLAENTTPATPASAPVSAAAASATTPISTDPAAAVAVLPDPNAPAPQPILAAPSQNVTLNLINRLVQKGILSQGEAADLTPSGDADDASHNDLQRLVACGGLNGHTKT